MMKALITGVSKGIGKALCSRLAAGGWEVIGIGRHCPADFPGRFLECDLASEQKLDEVLVALAEEPIDAIVNNAGISRNLPLDDIQVSDLRELMEVNLRAPLQIISSLAPGMRQRGFGRIVNVTSRAQFGLANFSVYAATKAGLAALGRSLAIELAPYGVTVNAVAPGPTDTETFWGALDPDSAETAAYLKSIPVGRMARPDEIAATIEHLLSAEAGFVTGQVLAACGGLTVGHVNA